MATSGVARTIQVVKPHIRMIKFKSQENQASLLGATQRVPDSTDPLSSSTAAVFQPPPLSGQLAESYQKPIGITPRGSGISDKNLPQKYRRKLIEDDEIDYILRGGPE